MAHKPIAISVIVPLALAGILTLSVLAAISSTNQAFAQAKKPTLLQIGIYPCCERKALDSAARLTFSGKLFTEGGTPPTGGITIDHGGKPYAEGPGGATIHLIGVSGFWFGTTNEFGSYSVSVDLEPGTYQINAHYAGDSDHESSDSRTITYTVTH